MNIQKALILTGIVTCSVTLSACVPAVIGGGAAVGTAAVQEKGLSGAWSDTKISSGIKLSLYQQDPDLHRLVDVNVQNGEVMLTGAVPNEQMHLDAVRISWEQQGVKRVIDNIGRSEGASLGTYTKDTWITTQLKSTLVFDGEVQSRNYTIKTVSGQVYLMGIAQDQEELDRVVDHARNTTGVSKVVSYVRLKDEVD
ncbi:MAG: BON domain-containing protein [Alphaproteobacteria bacterium]|jgi:osmotically-inducible protein OsmY|nr:BON domain-containing protein [Alphaproteobacteria bacterium]